MVHRGGGNENGVAPVIAALLILALTIFLTGIFVVGILYTGNVDSTPIAGITISETNGVITLTHFSGDTLPAGEYAILVDGIDQTQAFQAEDVDFSPGTKLSWDRGTSQPLHQVSVVYTGMGGSVVIAEKQFYRDGKGEVNAAFTTVITEGKNATSQVKFGISGTKPLPGVIADQADIWAALDSVSNQATLEFTAEESSPDVEFTWTGGNGQTADTRVASFVYDTAGTYTVRLDIRNTTSGETGTHSMILAVRDPGVTAMAWVKRDSLVTSGIVARTTGNITPTKPDGGWQIQYDNISNFRIVFKVVLTNTSSLGNSYYQIHSKVEMVPMTWYHVAGVVNQCGTTKEETLRIYVDGEYPASPEYQGDPTGNKYVVSPSATIKLNPLFNVSSYSEVPFPLSGPDIAAIYAAERYDPR